EPWRSLMVCSESFIKLFLHD
ncbi:hypothetical protein D027_1615B, partial [Vibrio parahaemolyticus 861]